MLWVHISKNTQHRFLWKLVLLTLELSWNKCVERQRGMLDKGIRAFFICTSRCIFPLPAAERIEQDRN